MGLTINAVSILLDAALIIVHLKVRKLLEHPGTYILMEGISLMMLSLGYIIEFT